MPHRALLVWLSHKRSVALVRPLFTRLGGAVVVLAGCHKFLFPDEDLLRQILVELDLISAQLLNLTSVNLSLLEVLAGKVVLDHLPLFGQVHAVLQPLIQLLVL